MRRLVLHSCSTIISTSPICWLLSSCHINHGEITHLVFIFQNFLITLGISPKGKRTRNRETDIRRTRFTDDDGTCRMTTLTVMTTTTIERLNYCELSSTSQGGRYGRRHSLLLIYIRVLSVTNVNATHRSLRQVKYKRMTRTRASSTVCRVTLTLLVYPYRLRPWSADGQRSGTAADRYRPARTKRRSLLKRVTHTAKSRFFLERHILNVCYGKLYNTYVFLTYSCMVSKLLHIIDFFATLWRQRVTFFFHYILRKYHS